MALPAWKFMLPADRWTPHPTLPELSFKGCLAFAFAPDADGAREVLRAYAAARGLDARWLDCVPSPVPFSPDLPAVLGWAEV